ncbi:MAG: GldG family protein [Ruminococcus sp.]|nr:GldG family protein [Ruminococcus sp.]
MSENKKDLLLSEDKQKENKTKSSKSVKESKLKAILHSRKFARGWLSAAVIAVFLACVVAVNIIANVLQDKFPSLAFDITSTNMFQLQGDTEKFVKNVDKDVTMYLLTTEDAFTSYDNYYGVAYFTQANQFFKEIAALNSHIKFKYKDVSSDPSFASKYSKLDLTNTGASTMLIVDAGNERYTGLEVNDLFEFEYDQDYANYTITSSKVEQAICTALLSVTQEAAAKACFVTSSGIPSEADGTNGKSTFTSLKTLLENQAYSTSEVDLDTKDDIPSDCDIVFFVGPSKDILSEALSKVQTYLDTAKKTDKTFVYIPNPYAIDGGTPNLDSFLEENGMKISDSWIFEQSDSYLTSIYPNDHEISIFDYAENDFLDSFDTSSKVVMGDTRPITITEGGDATALLNSSTDADTIPFTATSEDDLIDGGGNAISGAAIKRSEISTDVHKNVVVIGSYYAISDEFLNKYTAYNNAAYFTNLFNSLTNSETQAVTIKSAAASDTALNIESTSQVTLPAIIFLGIIPVGTLILGIVIWAIRRKK